MSLCSREYLHNSRLCLCSFTSQLLQLSPFLLSSLGLKWTLPSICTQSLGQVFLIFCTVLSGIFSLTKSGHLTPFPPLLKSSQITFFSRCPTTDVHVYWCRYWSVCVVVVVTVLSLDALTFVLLFLHWTGHNYK